MTFRASLTGPNQSQFDIFRRFSQQRIEASASRAVHKAGRGALTEIRSQFSGAGLGRLGFAIGATSDLDKNRINRRGATGFSVSSAIHLRSRSERTIGAIESYTKGSTITPRRGRWLWIATDEIPRVTGRVRITPELYRKNGFEQKIGPLVFVRSINGSPLLVVKNASVNAGGKSRSAKSLTKRGALRKGQRAKDFIVAFIGIPHTARAARVDVNAIVEAAQTRLPAAFYEEFGKEKG